MMSEQKPCSLSTSGEYSQAMLRAERVVKYDPTNVKGHYRLGESCFGMKDYKGAVIAYENVLRYDAGNMAAKRQLATSKALMRREIQAEKQMYSDIFSKLSEAKTPPAAAMSG